jgi:hypothetical protein
MMAFVNFLSNSLRFDPVFYSSEWVDLEYIAKKAQIDDSYLISREIRRSFPTWTLDGLKVKVNMDFDEIDSRTIYVESRDFLTAEALLEAFPNGQVYTPTKKSLYAFVTFDTIAQAQNISGGEWKLLPKLKWNSLTKEYALLRKATPILNTPKNPVLYRNGIFAAFFNVHRDTSRIVLKRLFELIAPVSYVDYESGKTSGHLRFKDPTGARLTEIYFGKECVIQTGGTCLGKIIISDTHYQAAVNGPITNTSGIVVHVLRGEKEEAYSSNVQFLRSKKQILGQSSKPQAPALKHVKFEYSDDEDAPSELLEKVEDNPRKRPMEEDNQPRPAKKQRKRNRKNKET